MLGFQSHQRLRPVLRPLSLVNPVLVAMPLVGTVLGVRRAFVNHLTLPPIRLVTSDVRPFAVQQPRQHCRARHVAAVATAICTNLVWLSTPTSAFIPRYHSLPFWVCTVVTCAARSCTLWLRKDLCRRTGRDNLGKAIRLRFRQSEPTLPSTAPVVILPVVTACLGDGPGQKYYRWGRRRLWL